MPGLKTNEVAGTRAVLRHYRMSAYKARQVLDLVRGQDVDRAEETLRATPREAARVVEKVLASAVANARNNDLLDPDELYVSACYADEGTTLKRWRPRARGRATRIRKRTCHITVIVSRLPEERLERRRARQSDATTALRARRVAASRREARRGARQAETAAEEAPVDEAVEEFEGTGVEDLGDTAVELGEAEDLEGAAAEEGEADAEDAAVLQTAGAQPEDEPAPAKKTAKAAAPAKKAAKATKASANDEPAPAEKAVKATKKAAKKRSGGTGDEADGRSADGEKD